MKFTKNGITFDAHSAIQADAFIAEGFTEAKEKAVEPMTARNEAAEPENRRKQGRPPRK